MKLSLTSVLGLALVGALVLSNSASACGCRRAGWLQFGLRCQARARCGCGAAGCGGGYGGGSVGGGYGAVGGIGGSGCGAGALGDGVASGGVIGGDAGGDLGDGYLGGPVAGAYGPGPVAGIGPGGYPGGGLGGGGAVYGPEAWAGAEARAAAQLPPPPPPAWRTLAGHADKLEWVPHPDRDEHPRAAMLKVEAPLHARVYLDGRELKQQTDGNWRYAPKEPLMLHLENVHTVRAEVDHQGQMLERWVTFRLQAGKLTRVVFE